MSTPPAPTIVEDVTCTACGCLCDDIALTVVDDRIIEARHACEVGRSWFFADRRSDNPAAATIDGRPVEPAEAIDRAAEILGKARSPIVLGLTRTTTETQAAAVALADRIGATIDPSGSGARVLAVQRVGRVTATFGEVRERADLVLFWGLDPVATHPRFWERFIEPAGRFVPEGRAGRTVLVADSRRTATADRADHFERIDAESWFESLWTLRSLVKGGQFDSDRTSGVMGDWADRLKRSRYGVLVFGPDLGRPTLVEAALTLVRDLNDFTRFVALPLAGPGNVTGAEAVLTWQTGFPRSVDFSTGYPRYLPGEATAAARLARGEADAALIVADDPWEDLPTAARDHLARIPTITIGPDATTSDHRSTVALASATSGIDAPGTVVRSDGVALRSRPALAPTLPTDRAWLEAIMDRFSSTQRRT